MLVKTLVKVTRLIPEKFLTIKKVMETVHDLTPLVIKVQHDTIYSEYRIQDGERRSKILDNFSTYHQIILLCYNNKISAVALNVSKENTNINFVTLLMVFPLFPRARHQIRHHVFEINAMSLINRKPQKTCKATFRVL